MSIHKIECSKGGLNRALYVGCALQVHNVICSYNPRKRYLANKIVTCFYTALVTVSKALLVDTNRKMTFRNGVVLRRRPRNLTLNLPQVRERF